MSQHVLFQNGNVFPYQTIQKLTCDEFLSSIEKRKRDEFNECIWKRFGTALERPPSPIPDQDITLLSENDDDIATKEIDT